MKSKLFCDLYNKLCNHNIGVSDVRLDEDGDLSMFDVPGFSKSGIATLTLIDQGKVIKVDTRYNKVDFIDLNIYQTVEEVFDYLSHVAFRWYLDYRDHGYGVPCEWVQYWTDEGLIEKKVSYTYEVIK